MAISFVGSNAAVSGSGSVTVNLPAGVQQNDVAYAMVASSSTVNEDVTEPGATWAELTDLYTNDTTDVNFAVYRKVMGAVPDASVTLDAAAATAAHVAIVVVLRGVNTTTPEDATTTTATLTSSGTPNNPSITTVTDGAWVLAFAGTSEADTVFNSPAGYGKLRQQASTNINAIVSSKLKAAAGAEDPAAYADIVGTIADSWAAATVAVRPAVAGGPYQMPRTVHQSRMRRAA